MARTCVSSIQLLVHAGSLYDQRVPKIDFAVFSTSMLSRFYLKSISTAIRMGQINGDESS